MKENSHNSDGWYDKGLTDYRLGNYEEALKYYNMVLEIDPKFKYWWFA